MFPNEPANVHINLDAVLPPRPHQRKNVKKTHQNDKRRAFLKENFFFF